MGDDGDMARDSFLKIVTPLAGLTFLAMYNVPIQSDDEPVEIEAAERPEIQVAEEPVYYEGCDEVRAMGKAPLLAGQPGYGEHMDGDGDGIACEPYYGN